MRVLLLISLGAATLAPQPTIPPIRIVSSAATPFVGRDCPYTGRTPAGAKAPDPRLTVRLNRERGRISFHIVNPRAEPLCALANFMAPKTALTASFNGRLLDTMAFEGRPPPGYTEIPAGAEIEGEYDLDFPYPDLPAGRVRFCVKLRWEKQAPETPYGRFPEVEQCVTG